ncbi:MAG TPA: hypothetical protein VMO17_21860 [Terriglobia bacterium]|nr:hypothetical protein [Terriglobia bacterium]
MLRRVSFALCILTLFCAVPGVKAGDDLYGSKGIVPEAVRQGKLGSCYFHAVIAALAQRRESLIRKMIQSNPDGSYTVTFGDGKKETAYPEDLRYTHDSGYDLSDGQWVAVLFRAYAQRVLRASLLQAIDASDIFALLKQPAEQLVASSDPPVLAYDRAIRAQVDQYGNIDRSNLEAGLKKEMAAFSVPDSVKSSLISLLESGGFFDKMVTMIQQNGELFGAYRAVGQGGIADRVMETMAGSRRFQENQSEAQTGEALAQAVSSGLPIVACTGGSLFYQQVAKGQTLPPDTDPWYVNAHCYTVLGYDSGAVNLRNPWAKHPDPDGIFNLPLRTFVPAYQGIVTPQ